MISAGVERGLPYMTYPEPWRGPPKQPPELFLRPAPKPLTTAPSRYNGTTVNTTTFPNGTRIAPSRPISKYPSPPASVVPVNLAQPKDEPDEQNMPAAYSPYRLYPHAPQFTPFPYSPLCQQSYMMRPNFPPTPLSPQEIFSPNTPTASNSQTFLSPPTTFSPPSSTIVKPGQSVLRDKRTPPTVVQTQTQVINTQPQMQQQPQIQQQLPNASFKVPCGKEGSMKHRILTTTRPEESTVLTSRSVAPLDLQRIAPEGRKRLQASTMSPPISPGSKKPPVLNNNKPVQNFTKGSWIQLANGEYRKIEEMRTEDFILSAEKSPALRLAESTVVKIEECSKGNVTVTLTYNQRRSQVEVESAPEHPYFVMGHGWASCNPDRTLQCYGLKVHRLQVGDILISLTPREPPAPPCPSTRVGTIMTTATTTAMTARQVTVSAISTEKEQTRPMNLHHATPLKVLSPDSLAAAKKRRWSAPDQICDEEGRSPLRKHRVE